MAHALVKFACNNPDVVWIEERPPSITLLVLFDCMDLASE